ncbi:MAG: DUF5668 domain-containing protein [Candidatus Kapabacteria bacterium]|jgi:predicted membrane protein|nr:DUF5668 domain-containing protein [Candidatus Kapabacteria bacterium]
MTTKNFLAIALIIFGIGLILEQMSWIDLSIAQWWPLIVIGFGLKLLYSTKGLTSGLLLTTVGLILLAHQLHFITSFWSFMWPSLLIIFGISMIAGKSRRKQKSAAGKQGFKQNTADEFDVNCLFTSIDQKLNSENFRSGSVSVLFGSAEVDLSQSRIATNGAIVDLSCIFGELTLIVPNECKVISNGTPIFGKLSDRTFNKNNLNADTPTIEINYSLVFAEIKIYSLAAEDSGKIF